jgi:tRNA-specific 2-thiouridylase
MLAFFLCLNYVKINLMIKDKIEKIIKDFHTVVKARNDKKLEVKKPRVIVGMSGGVDSSVAAALLQKQGYDVVGIFMKLWAEKTDKTDLVRENICCSIEASTAARAVAEKLGIPFYVVNFEKEFKKAVVDYYIEEYESGRTPNPCVICNRDIKGEVLLKKANELNADYLATGHYARIQEAKSLKLKAESKRYRFMKAKDEKKDQTYFLWTLTQEKLAHILFPCGAFTKPEIRKMALEFGLPTATRRESQGICFIPDRNVGGFLRRYAQNLTEPGPIVNMEGKIIGTHDGLINYTIGQREGLGLGGPDAYYVVRLNSKANTLVVGDNADLFTKELIATSINWINKPKTNEISARIRHGHPIEKCKIEADGFDLKVKFTKPQRAVTPGQSIVFYKGDEVLGGGVIK